MSVQSVPDDYRSLTIYLGVKGASGAIEFYKKAFGATQDFRLDTPDGRVGHAALRIGSSMLMLGEPCEEGVLGSPAADSKVPSGLYLYVDDADQVFNQALDAGAEQIMPMADQFYGDRSGTLRDPYGHVWFIATHKEDIAPEEIRRRAEEMFKQS
ncbi:VOC family protein [Pseudomonas syringae]|uniref:Glyoxalase n=1 Tax=Pseudomonas syringae TaxID=317 RepID=A0A085VEG6_PSESX|nr:VOC family protein [Pseudomonas syringae]KFE53829.1 glyoxalase [Pseudomonas syringae]